PAARPAVRPVVVGAVGGGASAAGREGRKRPAARALSRYRLTPYSRPTPPGRPRRASRAYSSPVAASDGEDVHRVPLAQPRRVVSVGRADEAVQEFHGSARTAGEVV